MDEAGRQLDIAIGAIPELVKHPDESAEYAEAQRVLRAALDEHARLVTAKILADWERERDEPHR